MGQFVETQAHRHSGLLPVLIYSSWYVAYVSGTIDRRIIYTKGNEVGRQNVEMLKGLSYFSFQSYLLIN